MSARFRFLLFPLFVGSISSFLVRRMGPSRSSLAFLGTKSTRASDPTPPHARVSQPKTVTASSAQKEIAKVKRDIAAMAKSIKMAALEISKLGEAIDKTEEELSNASTSSDRDRLDFRLKRLVRGQEFYMVSLQSKEQAMQAKELSLAKAQSAESAEYLQMHKAIAKAQSPESAEYLQMHKAKRNRSGLAAKENNITEQKNFLVAQDFAVYRQKEAFLIDKSLWIKKVTSMQFVVNRRPRRFGKTLFLSMLKYFFYGAADLFEGLAVYNQTISTGDGYLWSPHNPSTHNFPPFAVVHLDFSLLSNCATADEFAAALTDQLKCIGKSNGCNVDSFVKHDTALRTLLVDLANQPLNLRRKVVFLIDEYDAPLNECADVEVGKEILDVYKHFFKTLKFLSGIVELAYITGITSYGLAGVFSGANNFEDVTNDAAFESMCAITESEFREAIRETRPLDMQMSEALMNTMKFEYNGYSWNLDQPRKERSTFFNPIFVAKYCKTGKIDDYWGLTSSESLMKRFPMLLSINVEEIILEDRKFLQTLWYPSVNTEHDSLRVMLEAGYFTVIDASIAEGTLKLGVPNVQTRKMLQSDYVKSIFPSDFILTLEFQAAQDALRSGNIVEFVKCLDDFRASIPSFHAKNFGNSESSFLILALQAMRMMGAEYASEEPSFQGRRSITLFTSQTLFILEFKAVDAGGNESILRNACQAAITQIGEKRYSDSQFVASRKERILKKVWVGVVADKNKFQRRFAFVGLSDRSVTSSHEAIEMFPINRKV